MADLTGRPVQGQAGEREQRGSDVRWRAGVFVSYARGDAAAVESLVQGIQRIRHPVWLDRSLDAGKAWWDEILRQISLCDAVVVALSPALLESQAAAAEQEYAIALGKPLLPVMVASLNPGVLPTYLATLQYIDYTNPSPVAGLDLANALAALLPAPPLPDPMPPRPDVPGSYLGDLAQRIQAQTLVLDEQLAIIGSLGVSLNRPRERSAAIELLTKLQGRHDLYHVAALEVDKLLPDAEDEPDSQPALSAVGVPAGWYPDPSRRHEMRWFDDDWTQHAADRGVVCEDPNF